VISRRRCPSRWPLALSPAFGSATDRSSSCQMVRDSDLPSHDDLRAIRWAPSPRYVPNVWAVGPVRVLTLCSSCPAVISSPLTDRTVDLLLTIYNFAGSLPGGGRRATACDGQATAVTRHGPEMRGCETRAAPGGPQESRGAGLFRSRPIREAGRRQSRPGRRSDDGQMILPLCRGNLECPADQVLPRLSGEFEPPALSALQDDKFPR
jgi:hypothetical protein